MTTTYLHLLTAVAALGSTAEDVADLLDAGGWTGIRGMATECPIARYLTDVIPYAVDAAVSEAAITVWTDDGFVEAVTPFGPAAFVAAFDDGHFPGLAVPADDY